MSAAAGGGAVELRPCAIRVVGVGGGGCNAVNRMVGAGVRGVDFWCVNTDALPLAGKAERCAGLHFGRVLTRGLGAGGEPAVGRAAVVKQVESVLFPTQEDRAPLARSGATKAAPGESWLER